jgi:hypothetical protein
LLSIILIGDYGYFKDWMFTPFKHHIGTYIKKPIRQIVKFIEDRFKSHDIIVFTNVSTMPPFRFYCQNRMGPIYYFFDPELLDTSWQRPIPESETVIPISKIDSIKAKRLWVVCSDWSRSGDLDENSRAVKNWLDKNLNLSRVKQFEGLWLFRYER